MRAFFPDYITVILLNIDSNGVKNYEYLLSIFLLQIFKEIIIIQCRLIIQSLHHKKKTVEKEKKI